MKSILDLKYRLKYTTPIKIHQFNDGYLLITSLPGASENLIVKGKNLEYAERRFYRRIEQAGINASKEVECKSFDSNMPVVIL